MSGRKYYEAYDDRYRQVHDRALQWASDTPSAIVEQVMERFGVSAGAKILELGCGEGRDAVYLLKHGYHLLATDISQEAVHYCRERHPRFAECFRVLDCVADELEDQYDFIYAVAVIHMLVEDADRAAFYRFIRKHLKENALALVCTMGDGTVEQKSDISNAFDLQVRTHGEIGEQIRIAGTSCRMVEWDTFLDELRKNNLRVVEQGLTSVEPDFPVMMYAVIQKG